MYFDEIISQKDFSFQWNFVSPMRVKSDKMNFPNGQISRSKNVKSFRYRQIISKKVLNAKYSKFDSSIEKYWVDRETRCVQNASYVFRPRSETSSNESLRFPFKIRFWVYIKFGFLPYLLSLMGCIRDSFRLKWIGGCWQNKGFISIFQCFQNL